MSQRPPQGQLVELNGLGLGEEGFKIISLRCCACNKERGKGEGSALRICSLSNLSILAHDSSYSPMSEASSGLGFRMVCLLRLYKASQLGSSPATCLFSFYDEVTPLVCSAYNLSACEIKVRKRVVKSNIIRRAVHVMEVLRI
jgi:hypothetical protein